MDGTNKLINKVCESKIYIDHTIKIENIGLWTYHLKTKKYTWSDQIYTIFGLSKNHEPLSNDQYRDFIHPYDWQKFYNANEKVMNNGEGYQLQLRIIKPDSKIKLIINKSEVIKDENGEPVQLVGTIMEVAEGQQIEQNLNHSELKFKSIFDNVINGILIANDKAEYKYANHAISNITGYSKEDLISMSLMDLTPQYNKVNIMIQFKEFIKKGKQRGEYQLIKKNGTIITAKYQAVANIEPGLHILILDDIIEKKNIKDKLISLDNKLKLSMKSAHQGLWEWDLETNGVIFDEIALEILGYSIDEFNGDLLNGTWWMNQVHPDDKHMMESRFIQYIKGEINEYSDEFRFKKNNDGYIWVFSTGRIIERNDAGEPRVIIGIFRDVSQRKKFEKEIEDKDIHYRHLFEKMGNAIAVYKAIEDGNDFIFIDFNKSAEKTDGLKKEELIGKKVTEIFPGVVKFGLMDVLKQVWRTGIPKEFPVSYYQDKRIKGWRKNFIYRLPTNEIVVVYNDVTDQVEMINTLREAKERLDILFDNAPDGIYLLDMNGAFTKLNDTAEKITGYKKDEVIGKTFVNLNIVQKKYLPLALKNLTKSKLRLPTGPDIYGIKRKDGSKIFTEISSFPVKINEELFVLGIARDITQRIKTDTLLRQNEERYRQLFNSSNDAIFLIDQNEYVLDCNKTAESIFGFKKNRVICHSMHPMLDNIIINQNDYSEFFDRYLRALEGENQRFDWNYKNSDGDFLIADVQMNRINLDEDTVIYVVISDRTLERKEQLIESKLASIVTFSDNAIIGKDDEGIIVSWNMGAEKMYGYSQEELIGKHISIIVPDEKRSELDYIMEEVTHGGFLKSFETKRKTKDGRIIDISLTISPIRDNHGWIKGLSAISHDITERKIAEDKLKQTRDELKKMNENLEGIVEKRTKEIQRLLIQKDEMINQMGHDLKNPLGPIVNLMPILIKNEADSKKLELMNAVYKSAKYMKNLIVKSIQLAKINSALVEFNFESLNLDAVVSEIIEANQLLFKEHDIEVNNLINRCFTVYADKLQLQELFSNLLNNAVKFTDGVGSIHIDAKEADGMIQISVSDQGIGMSEDQLFRVFDEFYKGDLSRSDFESSGLGMSICKRIVEKHGGHIWAASDGLGKGSTFTFTLKSV